MYALEGGSVGFQLGAESTDVVLLVMNKRGVDALLSSKVKPGGNASFAAVPKCRNREASTVVSIPVDILSYSLPRALSAGAPFACTSLPPSHDAHPTFYSLSLPSLPTLTAPRVSTSLPIARIPPSIAGRLPAMVMPSTG